jgi:acetyl esterase/lipase
MTMFALPRQIGKLLLGNQPQDDRITTSKGHQMNRNTRGVRTRSLALVIAIMALASILMVQHHPSLAVGDELPPATTEPSIRLWQQDAPGAQGTADIDIPTITPFFPAPGKATGAAFIVCPGGAYMHLAPHEGKPVAQWLNSIGITSFVLKYRLGPKYHHPVELEDAQRAIRYVRSRASEWNLDPKRVGIIGFSAGGHLASSAATHFDDGQPNAPDPVDRLGSRPDLAILMYPVITMYDPFEHHNSRDNLLGKDPDPALVELLSSDRQVTPQTPPCFLVHGSDDRTVAVENSLLFAMACHKNKVPVELHIFEHGPHGFGLGGNDPILSTWPSMAATWLQKHNFTKD